MRFLTCLILSLAISVSAFAQGVSVTGTVTDPAGAPIFGVTVTVEGNTSLGTTTDANGSYQLTVPSQQSVLNFSYIGYNDVAEAVGQRVRIDVSMAESSDVLDEVVVIGYGTVRRRDLTGAVASISGEKLAANPVSNVAQALQGMLPGVSVTSQDGRPGATMSVRVRGGGSITQSNEPLYIVDGVQVSNINDVPADNIESIDVLKDAASTAIYGARGANGVILVTTKTPKVSDRVTVRYNAYYQTKKAAAYQEGMDAYDYVYNTWAYATAYLPSEGEGIARYFGLGSANGNHLNDYRNVKAHNYLDDVLRTAGTWNHDLSLSAGNDRTKFYAAINYLDDEGIRIASNFSRWNANFKVDQKITDKLSLNVDLRYSRMKSDGASYGYASSSFRYRPIDNPLGTGPTSDLSQGANSVEDIGNPLLNIANNAQITATDRFQGKGALNWKIVEGLTANTELSLAKSWRDQKSWRGPLATNSQATLNKRNNYNVRWASTLNYVVQCLGENHNLSILAGNEVLASKQDETRIIGAGYPEEFTMDDAFGMINMTDKNLGGDSFLNTVGTPNHTLSWFGRMNYDFKGRYLLTATFRADGSSKFAPENRWGYFPAAAAAWRISDEPFMEGAANWLDNLKLRVSFGTSGSDGIDASLWKETWKTKNITVDNVPMVVYIPNEMLGNPNLKWETTISRNLGLDFGFWNSRLRGSIDAYWNTTKDILMKIPVDASSGYSYQFQNVGQTSNKGFEVSLGADLVRKKDFNLAFNMTYNFNHNNIDKIDNNALADAHTGWGSSMRKPQYDYIIRQGQPVGLVQGYKSQGFYTIDDFDYVGGVYTLKTGVPDIRGIVNYPPGVYNGFSLPAGQIAFPGAAKFEDVDGSGTTDEDDLAIIGHTMPKHTGGFSFNGNWKNLDFAANFTYQIGGDIYNANRMHAMMGNKNTSYGWNRLKFIKDTYKYYDVNSSGDLVFVTDPSALAALNANTKYPTFFAEYGITSSQFMEDASYLRLQNLTVGYTLPKAWMNKIGIQNIRVYVTGSNLLTLTGYSGLDPDVNTDTDGVDGFPIPNYDYEPYPRARTFTFGINLTF